MTKRICLENISGSCRNLSKGLQRLDEDTNSNLECSYCLRENGCDGNGEFLVEAEKALKVFEILKEKINY